MLWLLYTLRWSQVFEGVLIKITASAANSWEAGDVWLLGYLAAMATDGQKSLCNWLLLRQFYNALWYCPGDLFRTVFHVDVSSNRLDCATEGRNKLVDLPTCYTKTEKKESGVLHIRGTCLGQMKSCVSPLPSNRHHRSSGDRLEGKGENYQVCSVQYCVQQLCTVRCTHIWTD